MISLSLPPFSPFLWSFPVSVECIRCPYLTIQRRQFLVCWDGIAFFPLSNLTLRCYRNISSLKQFSLIKSRTRCNHLFETDRHCVNKSSTLLLRATSDPSSASLPIPPPHPPDPDTITAKGLSQSLGFNRVTICQVIKSA